MTNPNFENRTLFHGDNLEFLRGMNSGTVHLIATDPPFKKGRDFHAVPTSLAAGAKFQDRWSWQRDVHDAWVDQITDDEPHVMNVINGSRKSYGDDMGAFLCFMGVRLLEMRRVLREDGSIYLHCDPTASHYLKELMDAIFGKRQFRNEIIWHYSGWNKKLTQYMERRHEVILFYAKRKRNQTFHYPTRPWVSREEYIKKCKQKVHEDEDGREYVLSDGGGGKRVRRYIEEAMSYGVPIDDVWTIDKLNNSDSENTGYPTQKPLPLYERIIKTSSNPGDIVLDPFCGCATTPIAAERLGRQWVGIDIWEGAHKQVIERLEQEGLAGPDQVPERLFTFGDVTFSTEPPVRTDDERVAVPYLPVKQQRASEAWQRLSHKEMVARLEEAQAEGDGGGCGRVLEREFMQLDHIRPRAGRGENFITNRILLCQPCNGRKREDLTLPGLVKANKKEGWMRDELLARIAQEKATAMAERVRDELS